MHECSNHRHSFRVAIGLGLLCASVGGCSPGIRWRGYTFEPVHADSRRDQKLTLVYFRHWTVVACTEFEENVLKNPTVREVLQPNGPFYCAVLDFLLDRALAEEWGVEEPPGVVILDPERRLLASLTGQISVEELLDAIESAQRHYAPATHPATSP